MKYVVRVVIDINDPIVKCIDIKFLECLRYGGVIYLHRNNEEGQCFDIFAPHGADSRTWSDKNAERMRIFGYNAVAAPAYLI